MARWDTPPEPARFEGDDLTPLVWLVNLLHAGFEFDASVFRQLVEMGASLADIGRTAREHGISSKAFVEAARESGVAGWQEAAEAFLKASALPTSSGSFPAKMSSPPAVPPRVCAFPEQRVLFGRVMTQVTTYHYVDDTGPYIFGEAVATSSFLTGPPLWGKLVDQSSGGKTEAIDLNAHIVAECPDDITVAGTPVVVEGPPAFSGWHARPRWRPCTHRHPRLQHGAW